MKQDRIFSIIGILVMAGLCFLPLRTWAAPCDSLPAGGTLTGVVNTYYPGVSTASAGATSIQVDTSAIRGSTARIATGDMLLVIQMQDADINYTNSNVYGDGVASNPANGWTALNSSGFFEYVVAQGAVSGGFVSITGAGTGNGLLHTYRTAAATSTTGQRTFQVVLVPRYRSATLGSSLTALPWDGRTGAILALDVSGTLTFGGTVSVDAMGFRGGGGRQLTGSTNTANTDYMNLATRNAHGAKGEGIAGTPLYVFDGTTVSNPGSRSIGYPQGTAGTDGSNARGAPGNAGGGGTDGNPSANDENSGGGGGGYGGLGGYGGNTWSSNLARGGHPGAAFPAATGTNARIAMGAGGGAGARNNSSGVAGSGGLGGGIVLIRAYQVTGTGTITANGNGNIAITTENDGSGGGGAGGTVVIVASSGTWTGLTVRARGGRGYDNDLTVSNDPHGPGGGGGGGIIWLSGSPASTSVTGGANGVTNTQQIAYGATSGANGAILTNVTPADIPGVRPCDPTGPTWARISGLWVDPSGMIEFAVSFQQGSRAFNLYETRDADGKGERRPLLDEPVPAMAHTGLQPVIYRANTRPIKLSYLLIEEIECGGTTRMMGPFPVGDVHLAEQLTLVEARVFNQALKGPQKSAVPLAPSPQSDTMRALKIELSRAGRVHLPLADLLAAGVPAKYKANPKLLRLTNLGNPVAFSVVKDSSGAAAIDFTAKAMATDYTTRNVYVLSWGAATVPEPSVKLTKSGFAERPGMTRVEQNHFYVPFISPEGDPWIWEFLSTWYPSDPISFDLPNLGSAPTGSIPVRIGVSGGTNHSHTIGASINGQPVGQVSFQGKSIAEIWGRIPGNALHQVGNVVTFAYSADVSGPNDGALAFVDVIDLGFQPATATDQVSVDRIAAYDPSISNLRGADYLIVTHSSFRHEADRIASSKSSAYRVSVVDVERAYDLYSSGVVEANAIAALIAETWNANRKGLKYVLLVGDDTYDPRDFAGEGHRSFIPSLNGWDEIFGRVPSENRYADVNGDGLPEVAIGRLPVSTADEARVMADKIAAQEAMLVKVAEGPHHVIAVDDQGPADPSFRGLAEEVVDHLPRQTRVIWADVGVGRDQARATLLSALLEGAPATHFFGHGSFETWTDNGLLTLDDMAGLAGSGAGMVVFSWTCQVQWYQNEPGHTINEALLLVPHGGAVASVGPSGISEPSAQRTLYLELYDNLNRGKTLGEALRVAKVKAMRSGGSSSSVVDGWNLLGDPSLNLKWRNGSE